MNTEDIISKVNNLDQYQKYTLYMDYFINHTALKYTKTESKYLHRDFKILSIDEFFNRNNVKIIDIGEEWEKQGHTVRVRTILNGAYEYFRVFHVILKN